MKQAIEAKDTLIVHGERQGKVKEVGKIRIISNVGEYYLKGEVLEGEIRHDDIATKGGASCIVILEGEMIK